jgi:lipoprotein-anchoring transpeptidase ErfK/SrfK
MTVLAAPGSGKSVGTMPGTTKYFGAGMVAWVRQIKNGYGLVTVPWTQNAHQSGWIRLAGLRREKTHIRVVASLSSRRMKIQKGCRTLFSTPMAIGAAASPSPRGLFWVTDPTPVPASAPQFGSYAFGLSTIQPNTPPGWSGGNQMAIHGTNNPSSIGTPASAGCLRVSEATLTKLRRLLRVGTPVEIRK